ncbi:class I SAM-dependent methyltransferase [Singulisphaera sp. GP187]|uniref:class I SAM-dependent methyltransferase n=1 Tax=Singulisphaera sp. GP187 TaxID=1882752 RepID=UPI000941214D
MRCCPLCAHRTEPYVEDRRRAYFQCLRCALVFADPASQLEAAEEKAEYDRHQNDPADWRYRRFLNRLAGPLLSRLSPGMQGLDYGCGPGPTLSVMLEEAGMSMAVFDPFYRPRTDVLNRTYDFVTCTEVVEHFSNPAQDWGRLTALLHPGSWLGIMTKLVINRERFATWHYKDDPTHVSFYSPETFAWLGTQFGLTVERVDQDVLMLRKMIGFRSA